MLDSETKRRIDTARDILVGKVPDPKSQVEQITIALIYKFMDDMDAEAEEMGGKRSFFVGDYAKFGWSKLLSPALSGYEMLSLYQESIEKMTRNEGIPQLFRDIFKNAYLPYRDPETLKLFLKTINEFNYEHSEKLGDAFEYLLSVLGSQGDAGQFRTPRHIIDFMVKVVDPKKDDSILDPACGTAGFLISAYKHVMASNEKDGKPGGALTPDERKKLAENIRGYDISPDMVRLSLVNLYLHGFSTPNIYEYDTLTSEERWNEYADVILANPPFMSPKGGIRPHKRFSVQSNRSEVLFVDYMAEHLTPNGKAGIIVPEGIIFQSAGAYKQLRKYLIENNYLWAVASLPAGVFNPYAGVKTSIIFLDKSLAKKTDKILFLKIEKDGFDLGAQRRALCNDMGDKPELCPKHSDLPDALSTLRNWHKSIMDGIPDSFAPTAASALFVPISMLAENDYNLSADRYREVTRVGKKAYPMVELREIAEISSGNSAPQAESLFINGKYPFFRTSDVGNFHITGNLVKSRDKLNEDGIKNLTLYPKGTILFPKSGASTYLNHRAILGVDGYVSSHLATIIPDETKILSRFLFRLLIDIDARKLTADQNYPSLKLSEIAKIKIPLPPLEAQVQIVDEIAAHQRIIDGARQIVEGWKPNLELELHQTLHDEVYEWGKAKIGDVCAFIDYRGKTPNKSESGVRLITAKNVKMGKFFDEPREYIADYDSWMTRGIPRKGDVLFTTEGPLGNVAIIDIDDEKFAVGQRIITLQSKEGIILPVYLANVLMSKSIQAEIEKLSTGSTVKGILARYFRDIEIPLPPLDIQREIIARIERERVIVEGNQELIRLFEEKIRKVIERVWEG